MVFDAKLLFAGHVLSAPMHTKETETWFTFSPSYSTPSNLLHKIKIESSSTGSSFPADLPGPVPPAVVSLEVDRDSRNLINPFMRVTN